MWRKLVINFYLCDIKLVTRKNCIINKYYYRCNIITINNNIVVVNIVIIINLIIINSAKQPFK
jgi:hypothetical protein